MLGKTKEKRNNPTMERVHDHHRHSYKHSKTTGGVDLLFSYYNLKHVTFLTDESWRATDCTFFIIHM